MNICHSRGRRPPVERRKSEPSGSIQGLRMLSNLVTADVESVRIGWRHVVRFEDVIDDATLTLFEAVPNIPAAG